MEGDGAKIVHGHKLKPPDQLGFQHRQTATEIEDHHVGRALTGHEEVVSDVVPNITRKVPNFERIPTGKV